MSRFAKTVIVALILLALPMKQWAQQPYRQYAENGILLDFHRIDNIDFRVFLLYNFAQDNRFVLIANDEPGQFSISTSEDLSENNFYEAFETFYQNTYSDFSMLSKMDIFDLMPTWKGCIQPSHFASITLDIALNNTRSNNICANSDPFCTSDVITFNAASSSQTADQLEGTILQDGCIGNSYNPSWYHMRIQTAGPFIIHLEGHDPNSPSITRDVDFCMWGPYTDPTSPCVAQLTTNKIVDCSFSASYSENIYLGYPDNQHDHGYADHGTVNYHMPQVGEYYILMITNYSQQPCVINFTKTEGTGETDCGILPGIVDNDGPYCVGETIHLTVNAQAGATYNWSGPAGFTSNQQNPTRPNCTMAMAGTYTCVTSVGSQTTSATTEVVVYPQPTANFTATSVCLGEATQFTNTSTTNPTGQQITGVQWNFGDGQTSTQQNPTHTYTQAGTFNVTLTVSCGNGHCTDTKTQTVTVHAAPAANAGPDQTIPYNTSTQLNGSGGAGSFSFHWEPANKVVNANAQNTQTVTLTQDQTYTLTVTNAQGQCVDTDEVTIHIEGGALAVTAIAAPSAICLGGSTQLTANAGGGMGSSTYSWSPTTALSNPNIYNPIANPTQTTTYTVTVTNPQTNQTATATVTVTVNDVIVEHEYHTICPGETYLWHDTPCSLEGQYEYNTVTDQGCDKTIYLHLDHYTTFDETTITAAICHGASYEFYGTLYTSSIYTSYTDHTVNGCDSIVRLELTVYEDNDITIKDVSLCPEQLPYTFYGIDYYEGVDVLVMDTDIHGCDSTVRLILSVSDYYIPETQVEHVCYNSGETPTFDWNPVGNHHFYIHEDGIYIDTLPTSTCEGIFRLNVYFQEVPDVEHFYVDDACDSYYWPVNGQTYYESGDYEHSVSMSPFPCSREYRLHLTMNDSDNSGQINFNNVCDEVDFTWFGENPHLNENGTYTFTDGTTAHGCDSALRVVVQNMRYTPDPTPIRCTDIHAVVFGDTIAVVTETEFFSFNYDFYVLEQGRSIWDECVWSISKPSWRIEPQFASDRKSSTCKVFVADRDNNHVELTCKVRNNCMEADEYKTHKFYLKSSYVGIDEFDTGGAKVCIVPNPNGGRMELRCENMEGRVDVKVFDMKGNQIDSFETTVGPNQSSHEYNMKRYSDGLYLFVISDSQHTVTRKVVITH